jgi:nucleotide-binding universal stress UspA family protein
MDEPTRILVSLDGSALATNALDHALVVFPEAEITVLNVIVPLDAPMSEGSILGTDEGLHEEERERAERVIEAAKRRADEQGATITAMTEEGSPADIILDYVSDHDIDHVVAGSHSGSDIGDSRERRHDPRQAVARACHDHVLKPDRPVFAPSMGAPDPHSAHRPVNGTIAVERQTDTV